MQQQRQLRLGDVLDDYCPRERRLTNHAIVAMIGPDVKQTRCTTCDTEHEYKHAKVPRQRKKSDTPAALYAQVLANGPKRVAHDPPPAGDEGESPEEPLLAGPPPNEPERDEPIAAEASAQAPPAAAAEADTTDQDDVDDDTEGPVHRPLIRATLPRQEGAPPPPRPAPEFTIRQPGGRQNRFRQRPGRGPQQFQSNRSNGSGGMGGGLHRGGMSRQGGGRPPQGAMSSRLARRNGPGRKR